VGYYYLCELGQKAYEAKGTRTGGDLSPEMQTTIHSGTVALCAAPHPGRHQWRHVISTDEERVVREHGVVYLSQGRETPAVGDPWMSPEGYCHVLEKAPAPDGGCYVLVKYEPAAPQATNQPAAS